MAEHESPAARRHRMAYAIRHASSVDEGAALLEAFERECKVPFDDLGSVDLPWELCEIKSLPDWSHVTPLGWAVQRRDAPTFREATMRAEDLLDCRRFELIGALALACEQAFELGDAKTCHAMSRLCQSAVMQVIGIATLRVAFGAGQDPAGDA